MVQFPIFAKYPINHGANVFRHVNGQINLYSFVLYCYTTILHQSRMEGGGGLYYLNLTLPMSAHNAICELLHVF